MKVNSRFLPPWAAFSSLHHLLHLLILCLQCKQFKLTPIVEQIFPKLRGNQRDSVREIMRLVMQTPTTCKAVLEESPVGGGKSIIGLLHNIVKSVVRNEDSWLALKDNLIANYWNDLKMVVSWCNKQAPEGERKYRTMHLTMYIVSFSGRSRMPSATYAEQRWDIELNWKESSVTRVFPPRGVRGWLPVLMPSDEDKKRSHDLTPYKKECARFLKAAKIHCVPVKHMIFLWDEYCGSSHALGPAYLQIAFMFGLIPSCRLRFEPDARMVAMEREHKRAYLALQHIFCSMFAESYKKPNGRRATRQHMPLVSEMHSSNVSTITKDGSPDPKFEGIVEHAPERLNGARWGKDGKLINISTDKKSRASVSSAKVQPTFFMYTGLSGAKWEGASVFLSCATARSSSANGGGTVYRPGHGIVDVGTLLKPVFNLMMGMSGSEGLRRITNSPMPLVSELHKVQFASDGIDKLHCHACVNCGLKHEQHRQVDNEFLCPEDADFAFSFSKNKEGKMQAPFGNALTASAGPYKLDYPLAIEHRGKLHWRFVAQSFRAKLQEVSNFCFAMVQSAKVVNKIVYRALASSLRCAALYSFWMQPIMTDVLCKLARRLLDQHYSVNIACHCVQLRSRLTAELTKCTDIFVLNHSDSSASAEWTSRVAEFKNPGPADFRRRVYVLNGNTVGLNLMINAPETHRKKFDLGDKITAATIIPAGLVLDERSVPQCAGRGTRVGSIVGTDENTCAYLHSNDKYGDHAKMAIYMVVPGGNDGEAMQSSIYNFTNIHGLYDKVCTIVSPGERAAPSRWHVGTQSIAPLEVGAEWPIPDKDAAKDTIESAASYPPLKRKPAPQPGFEEEEKKKKSVPLCEVDEVLDESSDEEEGSVDEAAAQRATAFINDMQDFENN